MNPLLSLMLLFCSLSIHSQSFTQQQRLDHLQRLQDSTTWDQNHFDIDKQVIGLDMAGPFELAAFPVPKYELLSGEANVAVGNLEARYSLEDKPLYSNSFYMYKNPVNADVLGDLENMIFFQIIVLNDTEEPEAQSVVWSRNHPDYYGQGYVKNGVSNIEYSAFVTAEGESFAIINTRLFNLKYGRTILIAPQKDRSLRSLQVELPDIESTSSEPFTRSILKQRQVKDFLTAKGNIK